MKVLHIINGLGAGGAERLIVETLPLLEQSGLEIDLLLLNEKKTPFYNELKDKFKGNIYSLGKHFYNPLYIFKLIPYIKRYDIIHIHLFPAQYFTAIAKFLCRSRAKLIFTEHNTTNTRLEKPILYPIERWIYKIYHKILCISEEVASALKNKLKIDDNKLEVLHNGINVEKFYTATAKKREELSISEDKKIIIMVAGFRVQKDHATVIKSLALLPQKYSLIFVGDGEERKYIETLIHQLKLEDRILLLGIRSDIPELYKMADIAVLSSHWEGFGLAAVEAMASGLPTIASDVPGLNTVVQNGGLLFPPKDEKTLTQLILSLEDQKYYEEISKKGEKKASQYDIKIMVSHLKQVYESIALQ